jgi:hypothetical protein
MRASQKGWIKTQKLLKKPRFPADGNILLQYGVQKLKADDQSFGWHKPMPCQPHQNN